MLLICVIVVKLALPYKLIKCRFNLFLFAYNYCVLRNCLVSESFVSQFYLK